MAQSIEVPGGVMAGQRKVWLGIGAFVCLAWFSLLAAAGALDGSALTTLVGGVIGALTVVVGGNVGEHFSRRPPAAAVSHKTPGLDATVEAVQKQIQRAGGRSEDST